MKKITVNGKEQPYKSDMTVSSLLVEILRAPGTVVVELNGEIIQCERYDDTPVNAGDTIEIVHFVGGG